MSCTTWSARPYRDAVVSPALLGAGRSRGSGAPQVSRGAYADSPPARETRPAAIESLAQPVRHNGPNRPNRVLAGETRTGHARWQWRGNLTSPSISLLAYFNGGETSA